MIAVFDVIIVQNTKRKKVNRNEIQEYVSNNFEKKKNDNKFQLLLHLIFFYRDCK